MKETETPKSDPTHRIVRVFISSTFRDMQEERGYLVRFVFPRLRETFLPRRIHWVDLDLCWGASKETALHQQTSKIGLEEIGCWGNIVT